MNKTEIIKALKLMLINETKKSFRLKELYKEETGKEFDEKEIESEFCGICCHKVDDCVCIETGRR